MINLMSNGTWEEAIREVLFFYFRNFVKRQRGVRVMFVALDWLEEFVKYIIVFGFIWKIPQCKKIELQKW